MEPNDLKKRFVGIYGGDESDLRVFSAAGRVNLIGEHIDYCGGKVFPAALNLRTTVVARKNGENVIRLAATTIDDRVTLDIGNLNAYRDLKWGDYQAGVAYVMQQAGYEIVGCDLLYDPHLKFHKTSSVGFCNLFATLPFHKCNCCATIVSQKCLMVKGFSRILMNSIKF